MKNIRLFVYVLLCSLSLSHVVVTNAADKNSAADSVAAKNLQVFPNSPIDLKDHGTSPIPTQKENHPTTPASLVIIASLANIPSSLSVDNLSVVRTMSSTFGLDELHSPNNKKALGKLDSNSQLFDHRTTPVSPKRK